MLRIVSVAAKLPNPGSVASYIIVHGCKVMCAVGRPECGGNSELVSGESTSLRCELQFAGVLRPRLRWTRDDRLVPSSDQSDILTAVLTVNVDAVSPADDNAVYQCQMTVGHVLHELCSITLHVDCESISSLGQR